VVSKLVLEPQSDVAPKNWADIVGTLSDEDDRLDQLVRGFESIHETISNEGPNIVLRKGMSTALPRIDAIIRAASKRNELKIEESDAKCNSTLIPFPQYWGMDVSTSNNIFAAIEPEHPARKTFPIIDALLSGFSHVPEPSKLRANAPGSAGYQYLASRIYSYYQEARYGVSQSVTAKTLKGYDENRRIVEHAISVSFNSQMDGILLAALDLNLKADVRKAHSTDRGVTVIERVGRSVLMGPGLLASQFFKTKVVTKKDRGSQPTRKTRN
jgi:hypothetical protein